MANIYIKTTITKLSHQFTYAFQSCGGVGNWARLLWRIDCFSGGDVITRLCDVDLLVLNVYSFGTNVKYSTKNSLFNNKPLF